METPFTRELSTCLISREQYLDALSLVSLPTSVIATKVDSTTDEWLYAADRNVTHENWLIRTVDEKKVRYKTTYPIFFDSYIDIGGVRLSDETSLHDCLAKKLICITALSTGVKHGKISARQTREICMIYDWIVRWRRSRGISSNKLLSHNNFEEYLKIVCLGDPLELPGTYARYVHLKSTLGESAHAALNLFINGKAKPDWMKLGSELGVSSQVLFFSKKFQAMVVEVSPPCDVPRQVHLPRDLQDFANEEKFSEDGLVEEGQLLSTTRMGLHLNVWDILWNLSSRGLLNHDPLSFDPFEEKGIKSYWIRYSRQKRRTKTLLPRDFLSLLNAAATWVLDFAEHIVLALRITQEDARLQNPRFMSTSLRDKLSSAFNDRIPNNMPRLWLGLSPNGVRSNPGFPQVGETLSVRQAVQLLLSASGILVAAFGARRGNEVSSLKTNCIIEDRKEMYELSIYIEKTLQDYDKIPVPGLIKNVVEILKQLTEKTRNLTGKDWLFDIISKPERSDSRIDCDWTTKLNDFANYNNLPTPEGWTCWELAAHQLRRGFAICYYFGFEMSSFDALSRFLRHFDPEMTRIYITNTIAGTMGRLMEELSARRLSTQENTSTADAAWLKKILSDLGDRKEAFEEVRCEALVFRMLKFLDRSERPIGRGARKLLDSLDAMVEDVGKRVRIGSRSNSPSSLTAPLIEVLKDFAKTHYLNPVPGHAAHCICKPGDADDAADAECLKEKTRHIKLTTGQSETISDEKPDYAFSSALICLSCKHGIALNENQKVIERKLNDYEIASEIGASQLVRKSSKEIFARLKEQVSFAENAVNSGNERA